MAKMIPPVIYEGTKSDGERSVFEWFKNDTTTKDWIVLHSLNLPEHPTLRFGEMDFLVLAPGFGVFSLEVKTGKVWRKDGLWYFQDRNGKVDCKKRSPFTQAKDAMYAVKNQIKEEFGDESPLYKLIFGFAACFIGLDFPIKKGTEWIPEEVFDVSNGNQIASFIRHLSKTLCAEWQEKHPDSAAFGEPPTKDDVEKLASFFRKDFETIESLSWKVNAAENDLVSLTKRQYDVLDELQDNDHLLIIGGAGTGKTLLALEEARRSNNGNVGFFCFNSNLGDWLSERCQDPTLKSHIGFVGTFSSFMLQAVVEANGPISQSIIDKPDFFPIVLPKLFSEAIAKHPVAFSELIIDEAQDLVTDDNLVFFDAILKGGLSKGRISIYGDFNNQSLFHPQISEKDAISMLKSSGNFVILRLDENCRNTINICSEIKLLTGISYKERPDWQAVGVAVDHRTFKDFEDESFKLKTLLSDLAAKISLDDVVVLSKNKLEKSCVKDVPMIKQFCIPKPHGPTFCTIAAYKGLESRVIILCDVDDYTDYKRELYVALSRAKILLVVFESEKAMNERLDMLLKNGGLQ